MAGLQDCVQQEQAVQYALKESERQINERLANLAHDLDRTRERRQALEKELANLITTVATIGPTPTLAAAIAAREQEIRTLTDQLLARDPSSLRVNLDDLRRFVTERLGNIRDLVNHNVVRARAQLRQHATTITLNARGDHYVATGEWNLLGNQPLGEEMRVWMVAGGGFEPPTFGL